MDGTESLTKQWRSLFIWTCPRIKRLMGISKARKRNLFLCISMYIKRTLSISGLSISEHFKEFMDQTTNHFMDAGFSTPGFFSLPVDISNYKKNGSKHGSVLIYVLIILVRNHPTKNLEREKIPPTTWLHHEWYTCWKATAMILNWRPVHCKAWVSGRHRFFARHVLPAISERLHDSSGMIIYIAQWLPKLKKNIQNNGKVSE